jgi:polyphosphate kinase
MSAKYPFTNKEISWLSFNERVLQEAADPSVPILARIRFLGIYSSNMDEFFRVRVATLRRLASLGLKKYREVSNDEHPGKVLAEIQKIFVRQHGRFDEIYSAILAELAIHGVDVIDESALDDLQKEYVRRFFRDKVRPRIFPVMTGKENGFPELVDRAVYLFVVLSDAGRKRQSFLYSVIELPTDTLSRFVILPQKNERRYIMLLDDVIRCNMDTIFAPFSLTPLGAYSIKMIRDAELDIEGDLSESLVHKINKSLKKRKQGNPVRFSYDAAMPEQALSYLLKKLALSSSDSILPGGRYNNHKDFINFPSIIGEQSEKSRQPFPHPFLPAGSSIMQQIDRQDIMLHFPWHSFDNFIDLLREAAIDPEVQGIRVTLYRVARNSNVVNALLNARRNGKLVIVILELQARFDEEANIYWADRLREEGAHVIYGVYGLKVHSKLCLIERKKTTNKKRSYACIGTGNFNESTAGIYTDSLLLTSRKAIVDEVKLLFDFFEHNYKVPRFDHLIVSPFYTRKKITKLITSEIENARAGKESFIRLKINNLSDPEMVRLLYGASEAGVKIQLIVRGMFSVVPGKPGLSDNIEAIGIVDSFLEHVRVFIFCSGGNPQYFISSSDWLPRNFDRRIEVTCPVYDDQIKEQLKNLFEISWHDNIKARILNEELSNSFRRDDSPPVRSQTAFGEYLSGL